MNKEFNNELQEILVWLDTLTPIGLDEAEQEINKKIREIKKEEGFY